MTSGQGGGDPGTDSERERSEWLQRTGPHALLRSLRPGDPAILGLTVRPGTLINDLAAIAVRFRSAAGQVTIPLPVFATYRRQWSLDLTASVPAGALAAAPDWQVEVVLSGSAGEPTELPVLQAPAPAWALSGFPEVAGTPWTLALEPAGTEG